MEVNGQLHGTAALPPRYTTNRMLSEPHSRSEHGGETKNPYLCQTRNQREADSKQSLLLFACFVVVSYLAYSSTLKREETCSSEKSVDFTGLHGVMS
jgi:hypothetical protein